MIAEPPVRLPLDQLPKIAELPDPFLLSDGTRLKTPADWPRRREELAGLTIAYEYGVLPPPVENLKSQVVSATVATQPAEPQGILASELLLTMGPQDKVKLHLHILRPALPAGKNDGEAKFPVIICGDKGPPPFGISPEVEAAVLRRGYILVEFDRTEVYADKKNVKAGGVFEAWPDYNGSALSAWAWAYHRVVDYVLTRPDVEKDHIAITGHSRGGKCVLLAGALDTRIALTNPNDSGCGGCGCYRFQAPKSEAIENILKNFPYWFEPHFSEFIGHVDQLPIDQHSVKALIAPRALLQTEAIGDLWANPEGSQQSYLAAREVFEFLNARDQIGLAWREGKHDHNLIDWNALLDFADWRFYDKRPGRAFDTLAFKDSEKKFSWSRPR